MQKSPSIPELLQKLQASEQDKVQLQASIKQLNECYQEKIAILENTIDAYENRLEELLTWKKNQIQSGLALVGKYEDENKKLLGIVDLLQEEFRKEREELEKAIKERDEVIERERAEKEELMAKSMESQNKIDGLVREHTKQIDQLKQELLLLKEQITEGTLQQSKQFYVYFKTSPNLSTSQQSTSNSNPNPEPSDQNQPSQNHPLKQQKSSINNQTSTSTNSQTRIKPLTYRSPSSLLVKI